MAAKTFYIKCCHLDLGDLTTQRGTGWPWNKFPRRHHGAGGLCEQTETQKDKATTCRVGSRKQKNTCVFLQVE